MPDASSSLPLFQRSSALALALVEAQTYPSLFEVAAWFLDSENTRSTYAWRYWRCESDSWSAWRRLGSDEQVRVPVRHETIQMEPSVFVGRLRELANWYRPRTTSAENGALVMRQARSTTLVGNEVPGWMISRRTARMREHYRSSVLPEWGNESRMQRVWQLYGRRFGDMRRESLFGEESPSASSSGALSDDLAVAAMMTPHVAHRLSGESAHMGQYTYRRRAVIFSEESASIAPPTQWVEVVVPLRPSARAAAPVTFEERQNTNSHAYLVSPRLGGRSRDYDAFADRMPVRHARRPLPPPLLPGAQAEAPRSFRSQFDRRGAGFYLLGSRQARQEALLQSYQEILRRFGGPRSLPSYPMPERVERPLPNSECALCFTNAIEVRIQPCGHAHACLECMQRLRASNAAFALCCPFCRAPITSVESV